jgi:Xaa-Pro aminopeptidase
MIRPSFVPILEQPDAEAAEGAGSVSLVDWEDGTDPYEVAGPLLRPDGEFGISDSAWAMHLLGLQRALPWSRYRSLTDCMPMMRAVKDDNELMRLAAAGAAADSTYGEIDSFVFVRGGRGAGPVLGRPQGR